MSLKIKGRKGFTITEIIVATAVFVVLFSAIMWMSTSSRAESSKSINYLRALELAQEGIDWVNSTPFGDVTDSNLSFLHGSLVDPSTGDSIKMPVAENAKNSVSETKYPQDYSKCYFYRTVKIEELNSSVPYGRFLKKVTIGIYWNEGKTPKKIEAASGEPDRMRKLYMSTIIFDDKAYY